MERRGFLKVAASTAAALVLGRRRALALQADSRIEILVDEPIGTIAPEIYGHFTEHLGSVIYDGIYVGEDSKIPNQQGLRSALVEKMRAIKAPVVRWSGGCFADSYNWRDGIGPRAKRPRRTNVSTDNFTAAQQKQNIPQVYETNEFGTSDFVRFCRLSGAEPYIAANLRSLTPLDFDHWVEYCSSPRGRTTLAETREAEIVLRGACATSAKAGFVAESDIHAHNTLDQPDQVKTHAGDVSVRPSSLSFTLPAGFSSED
jgi:alpha-N-arabinofuranosidase